MKYSFILLGAVFGFLLNRAGATTFDFYAKLFLFQDFQLLWVIVSAIAVGIVGVALLKRMRARSIVGNAPLAFETRPMRRGLIVGALLFGVGWGLTGSCPGTVPAMIGEGKMLPLFTLIGLVLGTYLFDRQKAMHEARAEDFHDR